MKHQILLKYQILVARKSADLSDKVNAALEKGWEPLV